MGSSAASLLQQGITSDPSLKRAQDAARHLATQEHWFCGEGDSDVPELVQALLKAIPALDMDLCTVLWPGMQRCCSSCLSCITGFHQMQEAMEQRDCPVMGEAMMLQAVQRLQGSLHTACTDLRSGSPGEAHLSMEGVLAFLEVLAVWRLLGDQEILDKAVAFILTMLDLQCDMDVDEHLPGMFILAAHHDARVRGFVQTHMLAGLPKLSSHEDVDGIPNFWSLLDTWVMTLSCGTSEGMYQLLPGREAYQQQEPFLLAGLSTLLAGCDPGAMHALVKRHPDIRSLVIQRVSAICRPGYDPDSVCNALQSLTALLQGLGDSFWSQAGEDGSRMGWTLASAANLVLDGLPRLREQAPFLTDLACKAMLALAESNVSPEGGIPLEREAVVFEKVYVLLTRVCRAITLLRDVPPDEQRTRVQLVQRGAWQVLLSLAQRRVCVAVFAAAFLDFLPGALAQANTASGHLPQRLLLTVAWADCQHVLHACNHPITVPPHLQMPQHLRPSHAVCPALWELLPHLAASPWGLQACLRLAATVAAGLQAALVARPPHTVLTARPSRVSGGNFTAARSRQEYTQGHQLAAQLQAAVQKLLGSISLSPEPLRRLLLGPVLPTTPGDMPPAAALADLLAMQCGANDALRSAAQQALCSIAPADSSQQLSDALTLLLKHPSTAAAIENAVPAHMQAIAGATVQQLCSSGSPAIASLELCAALCSAGADLQSGQLDSTADCGWETALRFLRMCVRDLRTAGGVSHGQLYPREVDAVLTATIRTISVLWVTHKHVHVTADSVPEEVQAALTFLEPFLAVRVARPRTSADLQEVWEAGLMAVTGDLPAPVPWGSAVNAAAVQVVEAEGVPDAVKEHLSRLLGPAAPDCVARVRVADAIRDLPRKNIIDLTTPTKSPASQARPLASALRTPENKGGSSGKGLSNSPLLSAWQRAQARLEQAGGAGPVHAEVGVAPIKAQGIQPLTFSRTGGPPQASATASVPKQAHVPVATLYERAGLKQPAPRRAAAAAAEARAVCHTHPPATTAEVHGSNGTGVLSAAAAARQSTHALPPAAATRVAPKVAPKAAAQKRPRLRDIVNGVVPSDSDEDKEKGLDEEDMPLYKRRKPREQPPPISHGGISRSAASSRGPAHVGSRGAAARPPPPRPARPPPQPPPPPAPPPPVLSSQLIEKTAQALKAANNPSKKIKLAPLPAVRGKGAGARTGAAAAQPAAPKTDLTHSSSEKSFTQRLLSSDVQEFTSSTTVIKKLPASFTRLKKYVESFEHLLMLEIQAQVSGSMAEGATMSCVSCSIVSVLRKDELWEVTAAVSSSSSAQGMLRNEDLVAVRVGNSAHGEKGEWRNDNSRLGLVVKSDMSPEKRSPTVTFHINLKSFKNNSMDLHSMHKVIRKGSQLALTHLLSVVPHMREVRALVNVHNLPRPLLQSLLQPTAPDAEEVQQLQSQDRLPRNLKGYLADTFNDTQQDADARVQAIRKACFHQKTSVKKTLIQGPPGTGKTSVICGVIACMLHGNTFKRGSVDERPAAVIGQGLRANSVPARRVLVCAQSNAAIDELLARLSARGLATGLHTTRAVSMLRLGSFESAHPAALQFHIDHVVDGLAPGKDQVAGGSEVARLRTELLAVVSKISKLKQGKSKKMDDLEKLDSQRRMLEARISKSSEAPLTRMARVTRDERRSVLRCAEVVVATLSAAGGDLPMLLASGGRGAAEDSALRFDAVIIDEAAQAIEPATLIPMHLLNPVKGQLVLVGDPQQLPPTVLSKAACAGLSQSLFERLQRGGADAALLRFQYRMHPAISAFPSAFFYSHDLCDGTTADGKRAAFHAKACLGPLAFFDVERGRQERGERSRSLMNHEEVKLIFTLLNFLFHNHELADVGTVAIIAAYKSQVNFIKQRLRSDLRQPAAAALVEVATVDAFQGREADVVLLSCVRAPWHGSGGSAGGSSTSGVGFLQDVRRMNVGLTRARRSLWVLGHVESLISSRPWRALIEHAAKEECLYQALPKYSDLLRMERPKLAKLPGKS